MQQPHYNKDLDVRQIGPEDLARARLVAGRAFMEHAEDWYGEDETALAGFDGEGTLVCALGYQPESLWWGAAQIPAGAIGGVATDPKHKRRGHAGGLMVQAIHILRERGCCVSPLWPFSFRWYGKFGWACPAPRLELKVWPDLVRQATEDDWGTVRRATADDATVVHRLHTEGAQLRNGQSVRSEAFWQKEDIRRELWVLEGDGEEHRLFRCNGNRGYGARPRQTHYRAGVARGFFCRPIEICAVLGRYGRGSRHETRTAARQLVAPRFS